MGCGQRVGMRQVAGECGEADHSSQVAECVPWQIQCIESVLRTISLGDRRSPLQAHRVAIPGEVGLVGCLMAP